MIFFTSITTDSQSVKRQSVPAFNHRICKDIAAVGMWHRSNNVPYATMTDRAVIFLLTLCVMRVL
jgi:hypothetical protein